MQRNFVFTWARCRIAPGIFALKRPPRWHLHPLSQHPKVRDKMEDKLGEKPREADTASQTSWKTRWETNPARRTQKALSIPTVNCLGTKLQLTPTGLHRPHQSTGTRYTNLQVQDVAGEHAVIHHQFVGGDVTTNWISLGQLYGS